MMFCSPWQYNGISYTIINAATIPPVFAFNYAALYPWLAASAPDAFISVGSMGLRF